MILRSTKKQEGKRKRKKRKFEKGREEEGGKIRCEWMGKEEGEEREKGGDEEDNESFFKKTLS